MTTQQQASETKTTLETRAAAAQEVGIKRLFANDPARFTDFSASAAGLLLDYSKTAIDATTRAALFALAEEAEVEAKRDSMFAGKRINITENRSVLHVALRAEPADGYRADGDPVSAEVMDVLNAMANFSTKVRNGEITGSGGDLITDVVNIGIGGSDLGPVMATLALAPYHDGPRTHFVSNVDGAHLADTLKGLEPKTTLFIIASKTFTTIETMTNAETARQWIVSALGEAAVGDHFAAVSTALDKVDAFGIASDRIFGFWEWVGGRYSIWSAIGLPLMLAIGPDNFRAFLSGAREIDQHFKSAPMDQNLPILLGLVGYWHRAMMDYPTRAIIPYDQRLSRFPAYLQQLDMESNGKGVGLDGKLVPISGPVVWGEPGTNGQHAFFQLIHQGTEIIPIEFLVGARAHEGSGMAMHQTLLLANCLAQSEALMKGRSLDEARQQLLEAGKSADDAERIAPHRVFSGNRPSVTILYAKLDPKTLGALIALYEHRVFVEAQLFGINAFDQWGVELGKELANNLVPVVTGEASADDRDASTKGLVAAIQSLRSA
ncbi:glucose-6-phosphate isomerase [Jiella sp. MQZ9-1]|uniref:Glucose-6-phosphate isomerase n=1 Tax=Jiella flava TaxID=2816857 RepID=A0A939JUX9_9HYPH|nr:glucose-6-phosphate isomerase [Jiella flava]MBO0663620.1 glucose-6-phosphate isomerase [Jiella flava]MCD2472195.1 glucose-6-phosphate isomerase [Jiella flava]